MNGSIFAIIGCLPLILIYPIGFYLFGIEAAFALGITYCVGLGIGVVSFAVAEF